MTTLALHDRPCPICGSAGHKPLTTRSLELPASPKPVHWELHDVVCECCAFVYAAKVFPPSYIEDYYERTTVKVATDYDMDARVALVKRYVRSGGSILEYGPGVGGFKDSLGDDYNVDECNIGDAPPTQQYDLTAAYFVVEHTDNPREFIRGMRCTTKPFGFVVVEVPDFYHFPKESLYPEHLNHFTEPHLRALMETCGLTIVETFYGHSRRFGMCMVGFVKPDTVAEASEIYMRFAK